MGEKPCRLFFIQQRRLIAATIRFFDLFSGIGGFREGLRRAGGFTCVGHCEVNAYADKNYRLLFDTEGEWFCNDARTIETERMPDFDLLCAGFPCQAFSIAGKREGFADARGTLFFEIARLVADKRPAYFILENVPGLLSHDKGKTFHTILSTLSELGYLSQYESKIKEAIEKYNAIGNEEGKPCNLMDYFDGSAAIKEKVISAVPSVKQKEGVLYGCTTLELTTFLEQPETEELYEYVTGQYSDGWGEGFEQQEIQVGDGEIYVHFWQGDDYEIQISDPDYQQKETEMRRPKMQLVGQDGNVFSILARANKLLQENGQGQEAKEMIARVQKSENYYQALYIISEYVETELSEDFQKATKPPKKRGKEECR